MAIPHQQLVADIDSFLAEVGMAPVTFGRKAMRDPNLVGDLKNGRRLFSTTEAKIRAFISEHRTKFRAQLRRAA